MAPIAPMAPMAPSAPSDPLRPLHPPCPLHAPSRTLRTLRTFRTLRTLLTPLRSASRAAVAGQPHPLRRRAARLPTRPRRACRPLPGERPRCTAACRRDRRVRAPSSHDGPAGGTPAGRRRAAKDQVGWYSVKRCKVRLVPSGAARVSACGRRRPPPSGRRRFVFHACSVG